MAPYYNYAVPHSMRKKNIYGISVENIKITSYNYIDELDLSVFAMTNVVSQSDLLPDVPREPLE